MSTTQPTIDEDALHTFKEDYFKPLFRCVSRLHIDLECLKDFDLGIVLSMIKTEVEYEYILSKLDEYNKSYNKDVLYHFSELAYTREDLDNFQNDPTNQLQITITAPPTNLYFEVTDLIRYINYKNQTFTPNEHAEVWFNFNRFEYPEQAKLLFLTDMYHGSVPFPAKFTSFKNADLPNDHIKYTDVWMIKEPLDFLTSPGVVHSLTTDVIFVNKHLVSPKLCHRDVITQLKDKDLIDKYLISKLADINLIIDFSYIDYRVLTKGDYTNGETTNQPEDKTMG